LSRNGGSSGVGQHAAPHLLLAAFHDHPRIPRVLGLALRHDEQLDSAWDEDFGWWLLLRGAQIAAAAVEGVMWRQLGVEGVATNNV
jgi:hypothetical protein